MPSTDKRPKGKTLTCRTQAEAEDILLRSTVGGDGELRDELVRAVASGDLPAPLRDVLTGYVRMSLETLVAAQSEAERLSGSCPSCRRLIEFASDLTVLAAELLDELGRVLAQTSASTTLPLEQYRRRVQDGASVVGWMRHVAGMRTSQVQ